MNGKICPHPSPIPAREGARLLAPFSLGRRVWDEGKSYLCSATPDTSTPYNSCNCAWILRVVMPRAYNDKILSSNPLKRVCPFWINWGSNAPLRSRRIPISASPNSPFIVFLLVPLRRFLGRSTAGSAFSSARCVSSSALKQRSIKA